MAQEANNKIPPAVTGALITKLVDVIIQAIKKFFVSEGDPKEPKKGKGKKRKWFKKKQD